MTLQHEDKLRQAADNPDMLRQVVVANEPFILFCASRAAKRHITKEDDEWAVALEGFVKAVDQFQADRGSFEGFAKVVIHNLIMDHYRKSNRQQRGQYGDLVDENTPAPAEQQELIFEIACLEAALKGYGVDFENLVDSSPKAEKTRRACQKAVNAILGRRQLMDELRSKKQLPLKAVAIESGVSGKILERHRPYIIAIVEIFMNELTYLSEYVGFVRREEK